MSDEKYAKLKLKRRKPTHQPLVNSRDNINNFEKQISLENEVSKKQEPVEKTSESTFSWLSQTRLNETEKPWYLVLKAACPDIKLKHLENVPDFPVFNQENAKMEKCQMEPEIFTLGTNVFAWVPFPPFYNPEVHVLPEEESLPSEKSTAEAHSLTGQSNSVTKHENCMSHTKNKLPSFSKKSIWAKDRIQLNGTDPAEMMENPFLGGIDKKLHFETSAMENKDPRWHRDLRQTAEMLTGIVSSDITGSAALPNDKSGKSPGIHCFSDQKSKGEKVSLGSISPVGTASTEKDASVILIEDSPDPAVGKQTCSNSNPDTEHSSKEANAKTVALLSCPMCVQQFPNGFTQLDIDSHLAKCLSESTEDVMW